MAAAAAVAEEPTPVLSGKALVSLWVAGQWVAGAAVATAAVARRAWGVDSPVVGASFMASIGAFLFSTLILLDVGQETLFKDFPLKGVIPPRKNFLLVTFAWAPFILVVFVGALVVEWYVAGPQGKWIGHALADVGVLGITALSCLFVIPTIALEVWKTKATGCCITVSEKMTRSKALKDQKFADVCG